MTYNREFYTIFVVDTRSIRYFCGRKPNDIETDEDKEEDSVSTEPLIQLEFEEPGFWDKIKSGMRWSFTELSVTICKYTVSGMLIAGLIFNVVPQSFIQDYLGQPGFVSLFGITVIAALMLCMCSWTHSVL